MLYARASMRTYQYASKYAAGIITFIIYFLCCYWVLRQNKLFIC